MSTYLLIAFLILTVAGALWLCRVHIAAWNLGFPQPKHLLTVTRDIDVPMRDNVILSCDIYRPRTEGKYPVLISRTPYGKTNREHDYEMFARLYASQGYVVIVQAVRGKHPSEGDFEPYVHEASDGHDTVEWAAQQPWSTGRVGMVGFSYLGSCVWLAATQPSEYLKALIPVFTCQDTYNIWMENGVSYVKDILFWLYKHHNHDVRPLAHQTIDPVLGQLPVCELDEKIGEKLPLFRKYMKHTMPGPFWEKRSSSHLIDQIEVPALYIGGWYDPFLIHGIEDFKKLCASPEESSRRLSRLVIGPWAHNPKLRFKEMKFGPDARFRHQLPRILEWIDAWLKGDEEKPPTGPTVRYFLMGKNEWRTSHCWPPEGVETRTLYLGSDGRANSHQGNGCLRWEPSQEAGKDRYIYDPSEPVPAIGNRMLYANGLDGPKDQNVFTGREDVLVYTSQPVAEDVEIIGSVAATLHVSSSAKDTDFSIKLCDVHPDGRALFLLSGFLRMRFRNSVSEPELIRPGEIYKITFDLGPIGHAILKGHSLRLLITSSDFPNYARNLNTGRNNETDTLYVNADQTIYHGGEYDSHITLPVLSR